MLGTARRRFFAAAVVVVVVLGAIGIYMLTRPPVAASGTAKLTIFNGTVQLKPAGNAASHSGATGELLSQGEQVTTGPSTRAAINFPDGSITRLDANTQLTISSLVQASGGGWQISLSQAVGKTWNRVAQLTGGSSFHVATPNQSTAEVRGTDFLVTIILNPDGSYTVRIDNFGGLIDVVVNGNRTSVPPNTSVTINKGATSAGTPGPIPAADLNDPFTVFNQTANSQTLGSTSTVSGGTLTAVASSGVQAGAAADGNTDLDFALGWPGSTYTFRVFAPDGTLFLEVTSSTPPIHIVVPKGQAGNWTYEVIDEQSKPGEPWVVVINSITPSTQNPVPFFVTSGPCTHSVKAGDADTWKVIARDAPGKPALTASGMPAWGTFVDNHDGTGTVKLSPPPDTPTQVLNLTFTATLAGASAPLSCTENVNGLPRSSSVGGAVSGGPGAGVVLTLSSDGSTVSTAADGSYAFSGLGAGTYTVTMTVPSGYSASGSTSATRSVDGTNSAVANFALTKVVQGTSPAPSSPTVSSNTTPPAATFGGTYTYQFAATGGAGPYTFTKVSGLMPPGLHLSKSGLLFGSVDPNATPLASARSGAGSSFMAIGLSPMSYTFGVQATGSDGRSSPPVNTTITVNPEPTITFKPVFPTLKTPSIGPTPTSEVPGPLQGTQGFPTQSGTPPANGFVILTPPGDTTVPYSQQFGVTGGTGPFSWTISSGDPSPWGLSLSASGLLNGTPTAAVDGGVIQVRVTDAAGAHADGQVDIDIYAAPRFSASGGQLTSTGSAEADAGRYFSDFVGFYQGGLPLASVTASSGALPPCLSVVFGEGVDVTGFLDPAKPACQGVFNFTLRATDLMGGHVDSNPLTLTVNPPIALAPAPPTATANGTYSWTPVASGGHPAAQYTYSFYGLPAFLVANGNRVTNANPNTLTVAGDYSVSVYVYDGVDSGYFPETITITGTPPLSVTGGPSSYYYDVTEAYSGGYAASGGVPPYTFSLVAPPPGMSVDANTGAIKGNATATGYYQFTGKVCDSTVGAAPNCVTQPGSVSIYYAPVLTPDALPHGVVGQPYTNAAWTGNTGSSTCCSGYANGLPAGMYSYTAPSGPGYDSIVITGTPQFAGTYTITTIGTDGAGVATPQVANTLIVDANPTPPAFNLSTLTPGVVGVPYSPSVCGAGGPGVCIVGAFTGGNPFDTSNPSTPTPYIGKKITPNAPSGMSFDITSGNLSITGTPTATSPMTTYTVTVTDAAGLIGSGSFTFQVEATAPTLAAMPPGGDVGFPYNFKLTSNTGSAPVGWTFSYQNCGGCFGQFGGVLPPTGTGSLQLASDGTLSGTPNTVGSYKFKVDATDALGVVSTLDVQIPISDPKLTITPPATSARQGEPYSGSFLVTGGTHPYTLTLVSGSPLTGLSLDRFGNLTGAPTDPAGTTSSFTVQATDLVGSTATLIVNMTVTQHAAASVRPASTDPPPSPSPSPSPSPVPSPGAPSPSPSPTTAAPRSSAAAGPNPSPSPTVASPNPSPTASAAASPTPIPAPSPSISPAASPSPSPSPSPTK